jgi:endonuclease/exonuclease/phosphatase (EEP) superfamily protein YafD
VSLAALLAFAGRWSWLCDLLANFRTHYALLLGLAIVLALVLRSWRIAAAAAVVLVMNAWPLYAAFAGGRAPAPRDAKPVRVVAFNIHVANDDVESIARYLESLDADVVVLEEVLPATAERLVPALPSLPEHYLEADHGIGGIVIFSRWPLLAPQPASRDGQPLGARVDVDLGDRRLRLFGVHLHWPLVPAAARVRNAQLAALGLELAECHGACVVVGDFNVTPWSSHFRDLLKMSGARDCARGRGWLPTWRSGLPAILRIRIDHCVAAGALGIADVRTGKSMGSDHFATINDLLVGSR